MGYPCPQFLLMCFLAPPLTWFERDEALTLQVPTIKGTRAPRALYKRYLEGSGRFRAGYSG